MVPGKRKQVKGTAGQRSSVLKKLHEVYAQWVSRYPLACQKGCSACCTRSVTMTGLEGEAIVEFFSKKGQEKELQGLLAATEAATNDRLMTTNQFARICLEQKELVEDEQGAWNFEPCIFLADTICTIYEVRPFGCRSFGSRVKCAAGRAAEVTPLYLTVNTVLMQIIEHLDSNGGHWGYMVDILKCQTGQSAGQGVVAAQSLPGFLVEPAEEKAVSRLLSKLYAAPVGTKSFAELIDNSQMME